MLLIVKITVLTWRFEWATEILREALVLFIFVHVGVTFRPVKVLTFADVSSDCRARALRPTKGCRSLHCPRDAGYSALLQIANGNRAALEQSAW